MTRGAAACAVSTRSGRSAPHTSATNAEYRTNRGVVMRCSINRVGPDAAARRDCGFRARHRTTDTRPARRNTTRTRRLVHATVGLDEQGIRGRFDPSMHIRRQQNCHRLQASKAAETHRCQVRYVTAALECVDLQTRGARWQQRTGFRQRWNPTRDCARNQTNACCARTRCYYFTIFLKAHRSDSVLRTIDS